MCEIRIRPLSRKRREGKERKPLVWVDVLCKSLDNANYKVKRQTVVKHRYAEIPMLCDDTLNNQFFTCLGNILNKSMGRFDVVRVFAFH